jgi:hypothetical protein
MEILENKIASMIEDGISEEFLTISGQIVNVVNNMINESDFKISFAAMNVLLALLTSPQRSIFNSKFTIFIASLVNKLKDNKIIIRH